MESGLFADLASPQQLDFSHMVALGLHIAYGQLASMMLRASRYENVLAFHVTPAGLVGIDYYAETITVHP